MQPDSFTHFVDLLQGAFHRWRPGNLTGHVDGEEQRIKAALSQSRHVDAARGISRTNIERGLGHHAHWRIVVRVDDESAGVKIPGAGGDVLVRSPLSHER
jgi:hypothetical protein